MSKKLDSIMERIPAATVNKVPQEIKINFRVKDEKIVRLNAEVPFSLKVQLKKYIAENPKETEKTIILKGLKLLGFDIAEEYLIDMRSLKD